MKTKRTNRLIALVLVVVMLVPMISIPATAWDIPSAATQFLTENFDAIEQNGDTIAVSTEDVPTKILGAHPYSKIVEKVAGEGDKFLLVPFKGIGNASRDKVDQDGNVVMENAKDSAGNIIYEYVYEQKLDENGQPVFDENDEPVMVQKMEIITKPVMVPVYEQEVDENGEPKVDENGNPVYKQEVDENGEPKVDENGDPVYVQKLDQNGDPMKEQAKDEEGNPLTEPELELVYDEEGNPVKDENDNYVTRPKTRPVTQPKKVPARETYSDGNLDKTMKMDNMSVSASDNGIVLEMDLFLHYDELAEEDCGYEYDGTYEPPVAEIQFGNVTHTKLNNSTSTNYISLAKINLKTGVIDNAGDRVPGVDNLKQDTWHTVKFVIDLVFGSYTTYIDGEQYATFGYISTGNTSAGLTNIGIGSGQLLIAKCGKQTGAYNNTPGVAYEDMSYIGVDNVAMYTDVDYVVKEEIYEPEILNKISGETFNTRHIGTSPKAFGYKSAPATARIVADPTDPTGADRCVRIDFRGYDGSAPDGYYLWGTGNKAAYLLRNVTIDENGILSANSDKGAVSGKIWGDDETERKYAPGQVPNPLYGSDHPDEPEYLPQYRLDPAKVIDNVNYYIVTSEYKDAKYGFSNVAAPTSPGNPLLNATMYDKVALQVKYYISEDAVGRIEMQMNSSNTDNGSNGWIDTINVEALANGEVHITHGGNYVVVAGAPTKVNREEWFTVNVVFDLRTQCEDIFLNGDYLYTLAPKAGIVEGAAVKADSWSIGKIIRGSNPAYLSGYFLVDDVMIFNDKGIVDDIYNRYYTEDFSNVTAETDLTTTGFATNLPSSVTFYDDTENGHDSAMKFIMGLDVETKEEKIFWTQDDLALPYYAEGTYKVLRKKLSLGGQQVTQLGFDSAEKVEDGAEGFGTWKLMRGEEEIIYRETDYIEYATYMCLGANANQDWTFANPGIGAATNTLVAADFEIFVSEDAAGTLLGKLLNYTNGSDKLKHLSLYSIDTEAGTIGFGDDTTAASFNKGEWNTISFILNVKTGEASIYINSVWAADGSVDASNISFMTNNWVLARLNAQPGEADALTGEVLFDDVRMFSVTDELVVINKDREGFISATYKGEPVQEGDKFFITDDVTDYEEVTFDVEAYEDILETGDMKDYELVFRHVTPTGLRFTAEVDEDLLDELKEEYGEENVKVGMVILPADTVVGWETITVKQLEAANLVYRNLVIDEFYEDNLIAASIANIQEKNITRDFRAMAYVEVTVSEMGNTATICSELMTANIAKVAVDYLDENDDLEGAIGEWVEYYASFYRG